MNKAIFAAWRLNAIRSILHFLFYLFFFFFFKSQFRAQKFYIFVWYHNLLLVILFTHQIFIHLINLYFSFAITGNWFLFCFFHLIHIFVAYFILFFSHPFSVVAPSLYLWFPSSNYALFSTRCRPILPLINKSHCMLLTESKFTHPLHYTIHQTSNTTQTQFTFTFTLSTTEMIPT